MPPTARKGRPTDPDTVTVSPAVGLTKTYPDVTAQWAQFVAEQDGNPALRSSWEFMRNAETVFLKDKRVTAVEGWAHLDDLPVAYLVKARPKPGRRGSTYEIIGAVRLDEIHEPTTVERLNPDLLEGDDAE